MKKILAVGISLLCAGLTFAGGIENKTNMSTGYLRNPSRNTENKRPEAAFYNIAGTAFMKDGLYIELGNQFIVKEYKNELKAMGTSYNDETFVYLYPNADIVYKHDRWAAFANFGIYAGGGKLEYTEGTAITTAIFGKKATEAGTAAAQYGAAGDTVSAGKYKALATALGGAANDHSFEVNSITYGWQLGGAYALTDFISVGAAFRLTYGTQTLKVTSAALTTVNGGDEISYNSSAVGVTGVFGLHAKPIDGLDLAGQFAWRSKMNYKLSDVKGTLTPSLLAGDEYRTDLAPVLNVGAGYRVIDPLYVSTSFNFYFNKLADMNTALGSNDYNNSFEIALGADYDIAKPVTASLGFAYGNQGVTEDSNNVFNPVLDSIQVGGGVEIRPIDDLTLTGGVTWVNYFKKNYADGAIELSKPLLLMFAIGATYRFGL